MRHQAAMQHRLQHKVAGILRKAEAKLPGGNPFAAHKKVHVHGGPKAKPTKSTWGRPHKPFKAGTQRYGGQ